MLEAEDLRSKKKVAWKRMLKTTNNMSREIEVLEKMRWSPNVIKMENYFFSKNYCDQIIQNIVLELGECDLEKYIFKIRDKRKDRMTLDEVKKMMKQVVTGIRDMHSLNICHRDMKP